jgi:putative membrane protein
MPAMLRYAPEKGSVKMETHTETTQRTPDTSTDLGMDRTRLAYDRTLLAWVRTATSLITFGFAIQQFFRVARAGAPETKGIITPHGFGLTMIVIGLLALMLATLDHRWRISALEARYPASGRCRSRASLLAALVGLLGLLGLISMILHD